MSAHLSAWARPDVIGAEVLLHCAAARSHVPGYPPPALPFHQYFMADQVSFRGRTPSSTSSPSAVRVLPSGMVGNSERGSLNLQTAFGSLSQRCAHPRRTALTTMSVRYSFDILDPHSDTLVRFKRRGNLCILNLLHLSGWFHYRQFGPP